MALIIVRTSGITTPGVNATTACLLEALIKFWGESRLVAFELDLVRAGFLEGDSFEKVLQKGYDQVASYVDGMATVRNVEPSGDGISLKVTSEFASSILLLYAAEQLFTELTDEEKQKMRDRIEQLHERLAHVESAAD